VSSRGPCGPAADWSMTGLSFPPTRSLADLIRLSDSPSLCCPPAPARQGYSSGQSAATGGHRLSASAGR
jgi:hypothetical protein